MQQLCQENSQLRKEGRTRELDTLMNIRCILIISARSQADTNHERLGASVRSILLAMLAQAISCSKSVLLSRTQAQIRTVVVCEAQSVSRQTAVARAETTTADSPTRTLAPRPVEEVPGCCCGGGQEEGLWRIEAALAAIASVGTTNGPEVQVLQDALRKARRAAQESPIPVQIAQSESFVERAKKWLEAHDALRAELEAGQARVKRLRAVAEQPVPPGDVDEIVTLRAKLASAEEARDAALQARPVKKFAIPGRDLPPMPKTRIPHDLYSWMQQCH